MIITVRNAQRRLRIDCEGLEPFANRAFHYCCEESGATTDEVREMTEISVVLVSDRRIAELHRQFMKIEGPTDVLTFQHGEIVVSVETARANAKRFGVPVIAEIQLYIVHGFLHLLGFDDKTTKGARTMEAAQDRVFAAMNASNVASLERAARLN